MRKFGLFVACGVMILMSVAWVEGQQGEKKKAGGGFQFGGGGIFGPGRSPLTLLDRSDVKKELEVSEDQIEKLPAEVMVAISKVLSEKQFKRFKQLELQKQENNAFKDESVQKSLSLTEEQKKSVNSLVTDSNKELAELGGKGGFGGFGKGGKDNKEKIDTIKKETKEKIYTVLSKDQKKAWRELVGEEFHFENIGFGGGAGGFGGFGKKGADTKKKDEKDK